MFLFLLVVCLIFRLSCCSAETCDDHGSVRLFGGPNEFEGRVEVCLEGDWARWCQSGDIDEEADVVCRQLGHDAGGFGVFSFHGVGTSSVFISNVDCQGMSNVTNITECSFKSSIGINCDSNDVAVICRDPACVGQLNTGKVVSNIAETEEVVEVCTSNGFRAGLCCEDFTMETATVLCSQQELSTNQGATVDGARHSRTLSYSCNGSEQDFGNCLHMVNPDLCQTVKFSCSEFTPGVETFMSPCSVVQSSMATPTGSPNTSGGSNTVVTTLVVVCVVLILLLVTAAIILAMVFCARRGRSSRVTLSRTVEKSGIYNANYELSSKSHRQDVGERIVHNDLYTRQEVPVASISLSANRSAPPQHDYTAIGVARTTDPSQLVPQHTLLHSLASNSDNSSHTYSKPTTPLTNYDRTMNGFDALGSSSLPANQTNDYSRLNSIQADPILDQSQTHSEDGAQYSQIDDTHKYSKLSDNSKGYSQLDACGPSPSPFEQQRPPEELVQPYEIPESPASNCADPDGDSRNHAYSTVAETDSTGYSKLHVFEDSQVNKNQPGDIAAANCTGQLHGCN